jgi:hypothetical protein
MKKIYSIFAVSLLLILSFALNAQKTFDEKELKTIDRKVDSMMALYIQYSTFSSESDLNSLSDEYIEGFEELFPSTNAEIVNDLDFEKKTPKKITVSQYIKFVKEWYPVGLITEIKNMQKKTRHYADQKNLYPVKVIKEVKGLYKNQATHKYTGEQLFTIEFDDELTTFKIQSIDEAGGSDSCNIYRKEGDDLLAKNAFKLARDKYEKARKYCPSDPLVIAGINKSELMIQENQKPVFLVLHFAPGLGTVNVTGNEKGTAATSESGLSYMGGVGIELGVMKGKTGLLSIGITLDYATYKSVSSINNIIGINADSLLDIDNENYALHYNISTLEETNNLSYFQVPVYVKYSFLLSKAISIYGKIGASFGINIGKKYTSTGMGEFSGAYGKYNGIILNGNQLESYGYGQYNLDVSGTNENVEFLNIAALAGVGINVSLSKTVDLFLGADYNYGVTNVAKPGGSNFSVTEGRNDMNSMYGMSKASINMLNLQVGINLKIFKY